MTRLYLYDDLVARRFEPFAMTRPISELRVGPRLIRERWAEALEGTSAGFISHAALAAFSEAGAPPSATGVVPAGSWLVNSRFIPKLEPIRHDGARALRNGGRVAAVQLQRDLPVGELGDGATPLEVLVSRGSTSREAEGWWLEEVWDLVRDLEPRLRADLERLVVGRESVSPAGCQVIGDAGVFVAPDAVIEPFVTFDCTGGPVVIESGATVHSFTRIQGPTWIGPRTLVGSDKITASVIGDASKVHGEVSHSVFLAYSNKSHDGFVGHSYLGRWVNIGANTVTSNLKNTYGPVALWTPAGVKSTNLQFLGTFFGDHAKTGIGLTLTTGTVIGAGAQVYGDRMPPKVVPPFAWGEHVPYETFELDKFLVVARRVMARRHVELDERARRHLCDVFAARWSVKS